MGLDLKTPLRNLVTIGWEPNDIPFMGWTTHEKDDLAVFIPLYPIPLSYSSTKKIYRLGYIGGNTINLLSMTERNPPLNVRWVLLLSSLPPRLDDDVFSLLRNQLCCKGFPDNLRAIRTIVLISGCGSCSLPGILSMVSCESVLGTSTIRCNSCEYHGWIGHKGTIIMPSVLSIAIFCRQRAIKTKWGKSMEKLVFPAD